ncbi:hypothetical protein O181_088661 [Austropuccinia psidii MF-1]|uniref:Uncharacterized protein n=1 Tax=Austropuccinia psidii MF-1 TaxID=1389203 RepID=A0A9Q3P753_9BASI|nr:hypothetical protein [Austropuccinia psidii MF-1]
MLKITPQSNLIIHPNPHLISVPTNRLIIIISLPLQILTVFPYGISDGNDLQSDSKLTIVGLKPLPESSQTCHITSDGGISVCLMEEIGQEEEFCTFEVDPFESVSLSHPILKTLINS